MSVAWSWKSVSIERSSKLKCMAIFEFSGNKCVCSMYLLNVLRFLGAFWQEPREIVAPQGTNAVEGQNHTSDLLFAQLQIQSPRRISRHCDLLKKRCRKKVKKSWFNHPRQVNCNCSLSCKDHSSLFGQQLLWSFGVRAFSHLLRLIPGLFLGMVSEPAARRIKNGAPATCWGPMHWLNAKCEMAQHLYQHKMQNGLSTVLLQ